MWSDVMQQLPAESALSARPRPYLNHAVDFKKQYTREQRTEMMQHVGWNVFHYPSEMVTGCDMLSDSGSTAMTNEQWASLHFGDESYGSNRGYFALRQSVCEVFGEQFFNDPLKNQPNAFLFHQGRSCEDTLYSMLGTIGENMKVVSNGHFDTTHANIEANGIEAVNLFSDDLKDPTSDNRFKGNMHIAKLEKLLEQEHEHIPLISITITNNTGGGQPVSLHNIKTVAALAHRYDIPFFLDACRFAENAWFIQQHEAEYAGKSIKEIVHEMFSYADGFTISFKKDGLVNMGGGLFFKEDGLFLEKYPQLPDRITDYQIIKEGNPSYGGMCGRDIMALATGLKTVIRDDYLAHRISQVCMFGEQMKEMGIPVLAPFGGHAVYLDINRFFEGTDMQPSDFGGISFTGMLLAAYGHRACELGYFAFGQYDAAHDREVFPEVNFVRFAIPRLRYEEQDLASVAEAVKALHDNRDLLPKVKVTHGRELTLRHFKARFEMEAPSMQPQCV